MGGEGVCREVCVGEGIRKGQGGDEWGGDTEAET